MTQSFVQRVQTFWAWYPTVAPKFYAAIEDGTFPDITDEIIVFMETNLPGLAWVFGPGEDGGHSFTLSGEGIVPLQILADYWLSKQVPIEGWTFYGSRQASSNLDDFAIQIGELGQVNVNDFVIRTEVDHEEQKLNLAIWNERFDEVPEDLHGQLVFLFLDETLGEFGVESSLGAIDIEPLEIDDMIGRLSELPQRLSEVQQIHDWEVLSPFDNYTAYQAQHVSDDLRGDTRLGITCITNELFSFFEQNGKLDEDPLAGTGASLLFIQVDGSEFVDGQQVDERERIEMAIAKELSMHQLGRTLGGGSADVNCYIDMILFDDAEGRRVVDGVLASLDRVAGHSWHSFA